ncbi:MAG TPA: glutathione peroxidase [Pseudorhodoferax sp.]|nr:glutathione peroxidase [Pseudorhodoferax sp.]
MPRIDDIPLQRIDGSTTTLAAFRGEVLLIVNVASQCGLTPQYKGLEALYQAKRGGGLPVLGFPTNNCAGQEPGSDAEIGEFCSMHYDVHFPMFSKISVKGEDRHPLYTALVQAQPQAHGDGPLRSKLEAMQLVDPGERGVLWNFEKFLIGRGGDVVARFAPDVAPDDAALVAAIDRELVRR